MIQVVCRLMGIASQLLEPCDREAVLGDLLRPARADGKGCLRYLAYWCGDR